MPMPGGGPMPQPGAAPLQPGGLQMPGGLDVSTYIQMEMLQQLRKMKKGKSHSDSDESGSDGGDDQDRSSSKLRNILRLRRRVRKHPLRIVTKYRQRCLDKAGITVMPGGTLSAPFAHPHVSLRIRETFGKMVGLWRCHYSVAQVLEHLEHRRVEQAAATCCQILKAIHQTALDQGSWNNSMVLLPWDDALRPDIFGGDPDEMMAAAQWNRGIRDLQSQVGASVRQQQQQQTGDQTGGPEDGQQQQTRRRARAKPGTRPPGPQQQAGGNAAGS